MQPGGDVLLADAPEGKPLAAGKNGRWHLVQLCCSQNKQQMLRRLLNDLQKRIESRKRKHVHLVDDVHPLLHLGGGIDCIVAQIADVVHAVVGGGIDLQHIHAGALVDGPARRAAVAGVAIVRVLTVDRFGQNLGTGCLARATGAGEEVGMAHLAGHQLGLQCLRHRHLAGNVIKGLRAVLPI